MTLCKLAHKAMTLSSVDAPKLAFLAVDGEFSFIAFDPGGLSFLATMSPRYIARCSAELESMLNVDELGMRIVEPVAAIVVFYPGGTVSHTNDELSMQVVESVAALAWRLGKKRTLSCKTLPDAEKLEKKFLNWPFTICCTLQSICYTKGGCFLYGGRKPDIGKRLRVMCWLRVSES